jgi:branched-chain amino acid transport system ATP-binding protein
MSALLSAQEVSLSFAGVRALDGVSLEVAPGELVAVIGPNGAGKTSLFNCISGVYRPQSGSLHFKGADLTEIAPHRIAALGVARMFQNLAMFDHLSTLENLMLGRHSQFGSHWWGDLLWSARTRDAEIAARDKAEQVIEFLNLERYRKHPVGMLSYGILKRIELGRALCMDPELLLLDEPAAGLNHEETEDMARYVLDIKEEFGIAQILIEHDLRFVLDLADRVTVLDFGRKIAEDVPDSIRNHPRVVEAYLGAGA